MGVPDLRLCCQGGVIYYKNLAKNYYDHNAKHDIKRKGRVSELNYAMIIDSV